MRITPILALAAASVSLAACGSGPTGPTTGTMSALVDGISWNAASARAERDPGINTITVSGATLGLAIGLSFPDEGTGTYDLEPGEMTILTLTDMDLNVWFANPLRGSGSVVVTTLTDSRIAGMFSFEAPPGPGSDAVGTRQVSAGVFDVRF